MKRLAKENQRLRSLQNSGRNDRIALTHVLGGPTAVSLNVYFRIRFLLAAIFPSVRMRSVEPAVSRIESRFTKRADALPRRGKYQRGNIPDYCPVGPIDDSCLTAGDSSCLTS
jgi:hypothetical protein